jgi:hypothetical protein
MQKVNLSFALAIMMIVAAPALATPTVTSVGVGANTGTLDCARTSDGGCQWRGANPSGYDTMGTLTHTATSAASSVSEIRGTASVYGEANLTSYLPTLHAYASSNGSYASDFSSLAGTRFRAGPPEVLYTGMGSSVADANIWAVQGFQYTGSTPFELTITGILDSIFSSSGERGKIGHSGFGISIFSTNGYVFDPNDRGLEYSTSVCPFFNSPSRFCPADPTIYAYARDTLTDSGSLSLSVAHVFNPGDTFLVGVFLDASVCCGQTVDSSHTLNLAFNDATNLVSIAVAGVVPEPGSVFLFTTGLALIASRRRRPGRPAPPPGC